MFDTKIVQLALWPSEVKLRKLGVSGVARVESAIARPWMGVGRRALAPASVAFESRVRASVQVGIARVSTRDDAGTSDLYANWRPDAPQGGAPAREERSGARRPSGGCRMRSQALVWSGVFSFAVTAYRKSFEVTEKAVPLGPSGRRSSRNFFAHPEGARNV